MRLGCAYFNFIQGSAWGYCCVSRILGVFWLDGTLREMPCRHFIRFRVCLIVLYTRASSDFENTLPECYSESIFFVQF